MSKLVFFWRGETLTFDVLLDFSLGDGSATANNSPTLDAAAARFGSTGILIDADSEYYHFNPANIMTSTAVGSMACSVRYPSAQPAAHMGLVHLRGNNANNNATLGTRANGEFAVNIGNASSGAVDLETTTINASTNTWYGVVVRWDSPNSKMCVEVYNSSGTLLEKVEDLVTAFDAPAAFDISSGLRIGVTGDPTTTIHLDNIFISAEYDEPLQNNLSILQIHDYVAPGLRLFWRCETLTLSATDDYTNSDDTTATANGAPTLDAAAARVGSTGILIDASEFYHFNPANLCSRFVGSLAISVRYVSAQPNDNIGLLNIRGNSSGDNITIGTVTNGEFKLNISNQSSGPVVLSTTTVNASLNVWYGVVVRWDQPANKRAVEVYDASGNLVQKVEDLSTAFDAPVTFDIGSGFRVGTSGTLGTAIHLDNIFASGSYNEPLQNNLVIADIGSYDSSMPSESKGNMAMLFLG